MNFNRDRFLVRLVCDFDYVGENCRVVFPLNKLDFAIEVLVCECNEILLDLLYVLLKLYFNYKIIFSVCFDIRYDDIENNEELSVQFGTNMIS